jgi:hypothetical protein
MSRSRSDVDALLRRASELSANVPSDAPRVDMSPEAIDLRLRQASDLSRASTELERLGRSKP